MVKQPFSFADLYCGGGFGARGVVGAGGKPLLAVDSWAIAADTYRANFPGAKVLSEPVESLSPTKAMGRRRLDLLVTSPECTNHTHARGNRPRVESSRETALSTLDWAEALTPRWIVIENVPNMRSWVRYKELTAGLESLGYGLKQKVVCSSWFGVPQRRRRLFIVAERGELPADIRIPNCRRAAAADILDRPGTWAETTLLSEGRAARTIEYAEAAIESLGKRESFLIVYYGSDKGGGWQSLSDPLRTVTTLDRFALVRPAPGGHRMRMLQPSELARAMGLPKAHKFPVGTRRDKVKLCGNGICAPVMRSVVAGLVSSRRGRRGSSHSK